MKTFSVAFVRQAPVLRRSNCSAPIHLPPGLPKENHFFCCPGLFITLLLPYPALVDFLNPFIFQCPVLSSLHFAVSRPFLSHTFFICPGLSGGDGAGGWQNNVTGALQAKKLLYFQNPRNSLSRSSYLNWALFQVLKPCCSVEIIFAFLRRSVQFSLLRDGKATHFNNSFC